MTQYTVEQLESVGGREWRKSDSLHRVYFDIQPEMVGMTIRYYNSGNIESATLDGDKISNSTAREYARDMNNQLWYDVPTGQFVHRGFANSWIVKRSIRNITGRIEAPVMA